LTFTWFDCIANFFAYLPFGFLLALVLRSQCNTALGIVIATLLSLLLSASMEYAQMYLPMRVSSNTDLLSNGLGGLFGAALAASIAARAWFAQIEMGRKKYFQRGTLSDFGLALTLLWVFAQINPSLHMLGNVFITEVAHPPFAQPTPQAFNLLESLAVMLNVLMLGGLLLTLLQAARDAFLVLLVLLCGVALAKFFAAALLLKSWALLLWLNSEAVLGMVCGLLLLAIAMALSHRLHRWLTTLSALAYLLLSNFLLDESSPVAAMPLFHWRYLHLLNYNGLTQTLTLLFPFLLLSYLWRTRQAD
jgi:VanZ family protein